MMKRNKPIGCRVLHFYKKVGVSEICMYCGKIKTNEEKSKEANRAKAKN